MAGDEKAACKEWRMKQDVNETTTGCGQDRSEMDEKPAKWTKVQKYTCEDGGTAEPSKPANSYPSTGSFFGTARSE